VIDKNTIQEILETARIEEVVSDFVTLKKNGSRYLGLCPFHNEKTPSFTVTPKLGIYKCFGCGKGGDSVNFVMEHEKFNYPEALKYLAKKFNIEIQEEEQSPEQVQAMQEGESLYHVSEFAAKYFAHNLFNSEQGKAIGLSYFIERGFREDIIKKFNLGYAIDEWSNFTDHALKNGYKLEYLEKTGLSIVKGDKKFDRFKGRVIFPIQNISGRVLGFGGRTLSSEKKVAKYLNSPESDIYHKSKVLYGINLAKKAIIEKDFCCLVEGYTDVISLHQAGIENVVSSSGTSLTTDQIRLIKRYTKNVTILYDGDAAGIKAAFRGIDMILEEGMDVKIVLFPEGEDPDSYARSHRSSEVEDFIRENSANFIFFKTKLLHEEAQGDPMKMANLTREIVHSIALIPDNIIRTVYIKECATLLKIGEETLMNELNKIRRKNYEGKIKEHQKESSSEVVTPIIPSPEKPKDDDYFSREILEAELIDYLIRFSFHNIEFHVEIDGKTETFSFTVASYIFEDLYRDDIKFNNPLYQHVFDVTANELLEDRTPNEKFYLNHPDSKIASLAATMLTEKYQLSNWESRKIKVTRVEDKLTIAIPKALNCLKTRFLEQKFDENQKRIQSSNFDDQLIGLSAQIVIKKKIKELSEATNRPILS
jgi:DNA primase